ncbi:MAG: hypothetical protein LUH05_08305 [Candidatus Gastranaerophilales bacterium]|nr:hypothetical protein [Candidatus Gastranaerophilales bacterium]
MQRKKYSKPIKVKTTLGEFIPEIELTYETENCDYIFTSTYDGSRTLPTKILKIMSNDENFTKGADKTNDER